MKNLFLFFLSLFFVTQLYTTDSSKSPKNYSYIVRIQTPPTIKSNHIKAYYKGTLLTFDESWCLLPEDQKSLTFSLVITPAEVEPICEGNTTRCLKRNPKIPCAWYDLTLHIDPQHKAGYTWTIEKKDSKDVPLRLPERTILLYTSPEYIEAIQHLETEKPAGFSSETMVVNFPTIVFTKTIDTESFEETTVTALLASLDLDTIHARVKTASKKDQHIVLSMMTGSPK